MKLHSYVVARDYGFAPNPFYGVCTLATCKPKIRSVARIGDWVVGTGSKVRGRGKHVVFAMRVTGTLTFEEYWVDPRFQDKKPNLRGSIKQAFGDNIYSKCAGTDAWCQANSHHSLEDGTPNAANVKADTGTDRMLFSDDFVYWGGCGPSLPSKFLDYGPHHISLCAVRGHKNTFPREFVEEFIAWLRSLGQSGFAGEPLDWSPRKQVIG
jgi:Nucleotide modification associated domain 2